MNDSRTVLQFGLWSFHPNEALADPLPKYQCSVGVVLLCNFDKPLKEEMC